MHTYVNEQYPPSANTKNATSGNALRLERAAAAALQKPSNTDESNNTVYRDSTQTQIYCIETITEYQTKMAHREYRTKHQAEKLGS